MKHLSKNKIHILFTLLNFIFIYAFDGAKIRITNHGSFINSIDSSKTIKPTGGVSDCWILLLTAKLPYLDVLGRAPRNTHLQRLS